MARQVVLPVNPDNSKQLGKSVVPLKIVQNAPRHVALQRNMVFRHCQRKLFQVPFEIVDAKSVVQHVGQAQISLSWNIDAIFRDVNLFGVKRAADPRNAFAKALRIHIKPIRSSLRSNQGAVERGVCVGNIHVIRPTIGRYAGTASLEKQEKN